MNAFRLSVLVETEVEMSEHDVQNRFKLIFQVLKEEIDKRFVMNGERQRVTVTPYSIDSLPD